MKKIAEELKHITEAYAARLKDISIGVYSAKPAPGKWSKKEILGHLIDSAQANIRRFIVGQYEDSPYIVYDQEKWVALSFYQDQDIGELVALWVLLNNHICFILFAMDQSASHKICKTNDQTPRDLQWLGADYIKHLLHHLHQILDLSPVAYP